MIQNCFKILIFFILVCDICCDTEKKCFADEYNCYNGTDAEPECIPLTKLCDGTPDCPSRLDEHFDVCGTRGCNRTDFQCAYGACVHMSKVCNLQKDCVDGSDESSCELKTPTITCRKTQITCQSGDQCIWPFQKCDGIRDCDDGSDETYQTCFGTVCEPHSYQCEYGACIPLSYLCDGQVECADASDELECPNSSWNSSYTNILKAPSSLCNPGYVKCTSGFCIKEDQVCDGIRHCDDGSDETYSRCHSEECSGFACNYGACIPRKNMTCEHCVDNTPGRYYFDLVMGDIADCGPIAQSDFEGDDYDDLAAPPRPQGLEVETELEIEGGIISSTPPLPQVVYASDDDEEGERSDDRFIPPPRPVEKPKPKQCYFPPQPKNGKFVPASTNKIGPDPLVATKFAILQYECEEGYVLNGEALIVCSGKKWNHKPPECARSCPPIESDKHDITCTYKKQEVECDEAFEGVVANVKCKEAFEVENLVLQPYNGIRCVNGSWSDKLFNCEAECGTIIPKAQALVVKGYTATRGEYPWHAGLYRHFNGHYDQLCGGTLIADKVVVSAAHCFWDWGSNTGNVNPDNWAIAVGKFYRKWNYPKDLHAQHFSIKKIILPAKFRADENSFANDIAIIILNSTVQFNSLVRPVCLDWSNTLSKILLKPGSLGAVVGWGLTEEFGDAAEELQAVQIPYIEFNKCIDELPADFRPFITNDKICAGYTNGTSVCQGDSGGGLAFRKSNRYFIQGVVSVAPPKGSTCDSFKYVAFTNIGHHLKWIEDCELNYIN